MKSSATSSAASPQHLDLVFVLFESDIAAMQRAFTTMGHSSDMSTPFSTASSSSAAVPFSSSSISSGPVVDKTTFIEILRRHSQQVVEHLKTPDGVTSLHQLFFHIDSDGDGLVSWNDLFQYVIDTAQQKLDTLPAERIKPYMFSRTQRRIDNVMYMNYFDGPDLLLLSSRHCPVELIRPHSMKVLHSFAPTQVGGLGVRPLSATYLTAVESLACFCSDMRLRVWCGVDRAVAAPCRPLKVEHSIAKLQYAPIIGPQTLLACDTNGSVTVIETNKQQLSEPQIKAAMSQLHDPMLGGVTDMVLWDSRASVVTSGYDRKLLLTDLTSQRPFTIGTASSVVRYVDIAEQQQLVLSVGFDNQLAGWVAQQPAKPCSEFTDLTRPHLHEIVGLKCIQGTPQVLTCDISGIVKIWDVRQLRCVQTFKANEGFHVDGESGLCNPCEGVAGKTVNAFAYIGSTREACCVDPTTLYFHVSDKGTEPTVAANAPLAAVRYNPLTRNIMAMTATHVQVWDEDHGYLLQTYDSAQKSADLTAFSLDGMGRRMFLGSQSGEVEIRSCNGGSLVRTIHPHHREIVGIEYSPQHRAIITASADGTLCTTVEGDGAAPPQKIKLSSEPMRALTFSQSLSLIACGGLNGKLNVLDVVPPRNTESQLVCPNYKVASVSCITFLGDFPLVAVGHSSGELLFWSVRPIKEEVLVFGMRLFTEPPLLTPVAPHSSSLDKSDLLSASSLPKAHHDATTAGAGAGTGVLQDSMTTSVRLSMFVPNATTSGSGGGLADALTDALQGKAPTRQSQISFIGDLNRNHWASSPLNFFAGHHLQAGAPPSGYTADEYPTAMAFHEQVHHLLVGTTKGNVYIYRLCPMLQHLQIPTCQYPHTQPFSIASQLEGARQRENSGLDSPLMPELIICVVGEHSQGDVVDAHVLPNHHLFATCGEDRRILLFDLYGTRVAQLSMGRLPPSQYPSSFPSTADEDSDDDDDEGRTSDDDEHDVGISSSSSPSAAARARRGSQPLNHHGEPDPSDPFVTMLMSPKAASSSASRGNGSMSSTVPEGALDTTATFGGSASTVSLMQKLAAVASNRQAPPAPTHSRVSTMPARSALGPAGKLDPNGAMHAIEEFDLTSRAVVIRGHRSKRKHREGGGLSSKVDRGTLCMHRPSAPPGATIGEEANLVDDDGMPVVLRIGRQAAKGEAQQSFQAVIANMANSGNNNNNLQTSMLSASSSANTPLSQHRPSAVPTPVPPAASTRQHRRSSVAFAEHFSSGAASKARTELSNASPFSAGLRDSYAAGLASFSMSETTTMASIGSGGVGGPVATGPPTPRCLLRLPQATDAAYQIRKNHHSGGDAFSPSQGGEDGGVTSRVDSSAVMTAQEIQDRTVKHLNTLLRHAAIHATSAGEEDDENKWDERSTQQSQSSPRRKLVQGEPQLVNWGPSDEQYLFSERSNRNPVAVGGAHEDVEDSKRLLRLTGGPTSASYDSEQGEISWRTVQSKQLAAAVSQQKSPSKEAPTSGVVQTLAHPTVQSSSSQAAVVVAEADLPPPSRVLDGTQDPNNDHVAQQQQNNILVTLEPLKPPGSSYGSSGAATTPRTMMLAPTAAGSNALRSRIGPLAPSHVLQSSSSSATDLHAAPKLLTPLEALQELHTLWNSDASWLGFALQSAPPMPTLSPRSGGVGGWDVGGGSSRPTTAERGGGGGGPPPSSSGRLGSGKLRIGILGMTDRPSTGGNPTSSGGGNSPPHRASSSPAATVSNNGLVVQSPMMATVRPPSTASSSYSARPCSGAVLPRVVSTVSVQPLLPTHPSSARPRTLSGREVPSPVREVRTGIHCQASPRTQSANPFRSHVHHGVAPLGGIERLPKAVRPPRVDAKTQRIALLETELKRCLLRRGSRGGNGQATTRKKTSMRGEDGDMAGDDGVAIDEDNWN